jgi:hypothetical protein
MMMSAMMAAGRMRITLTVTVEGPLHGPRGTVPSAAAAQRHQQTSPRRTVAGSLISFFVLLLNQRLMQSWHQRDCALEGSGILIREVAFVSTHF